MDLEGGLPQWEAVAEGSPDWEQIFGPAVSTVDWPSARYYPELMKVAGKYLDAVSINYYNNWTPEKTWVRDWEIFAGKPFIVTEWYVKGEDATKGEVFSVERDGLGGEEMKRDRVAGEGIDDEHIEVLRSFASKGGSAVAVDDGDLRG